MTRHGIEHNLKRSPYLVDMRYSDSMATYYFSSITGMEKFLTSCERNRYDINDSLTRRFKINVTISNLFSDLVLYSKVESRGFYVVLNEEVITCLQSLQYDGQKLSKMTLEER